MKKIILILLVLVGFTKLYGQNNANQPEHKIIFQLSNCDTLSHKALMKQIGNILSVSLTTQIEVVCHGPGLSVLVTHQSTITEKIKFFVNKGVVFSACEFSMKERNVEKSQFIPEATYVKAGIIAIVSKQEQGWSYIKAGF